MQACRYHYCHSKVQYCSYNYNAQFHDRENWQPSNTSQKHSCLLHYIHVTTHALEAIRTLTVNMTPRIRARRKTETSPQIANIHGRLLLSKNVLVFFSTESVNKMQWSSCPWYFLRIFWYSFAKLPNEMIAKRQTMAQATTMKPWKTRDPVFLTISVVLCSPT